MTLCNNFPVYTDIKCGFTVNNPNLPEASCLNIKDSSFISFPLLQGLSVH